jgi:uncharacterized membrane protein YvbJ
MFCAQCGANNADGATFCSQCGGNLLAGAALAPRAGAAILPAGVNVPNYLVFAILATVLCCLPAGIPAIVYAAQVNGKLQAGDLTGAQSASNNAKMWCWISFGLGLCVVVIYGVIVAAGIMGRMNR